MRTTIAIPDEFIKDLLHFAHTKKTTEAVNVAIKEWVRLQKIKEIKKLQGKLAIDENLEQVRTKEINKLEQWHE